MALFDARAAPLLPSKDHHLSTDTGSNQPVQLPAGAPPSYRRSPWDASAVVRRRLTR